MQTYACKWKFCTLLRVQELEQCDFKKTTYVLEQTHFGLTDPSILILHDDDDSSSLSISRIELGVWFFFFFHFFCWLAQYLIKHWMADPPTANQILFVEENKYYFFFNHFFERKMCPPNNEAASWMENHNFPLYHKILSSHKCTLHG